MNNMRFFILSLLCTTAIAGDPADDLVPTFYQPAVTSTFDVSSEMVIAAMDYCHPALNDPCLGREISFIIRYPTDTVGPQPVVILSHGGSGENFGAGGPMAAWGQWLVEAGYVAVSVAHPARTPSEESDLCAALNVPNGTMGCAEYGTINWDRPQDIRRVLVALNDLASAAPWDQRLDLDRLGVLGYSGGAAGAMSAAGVDRVLKYAPDGSPLVPDVSLSGIEAMVALSPSRPGRIGFFDTTKDKDDHSWQDLAVPTLTMTGGDGQWTRHSPDVLLADGFES